MKRITRHITKKRNWLSIAAMLLILAGVLYVGVPKMQAATIRYHGRSQNDQQVRQAVRGVAAETRTAMTFGTPISLSLPRLGVSLSVLPGAYNATSRTWTLDSEHAFNMQSSQGITGKTPIIYGHNTPAVFRKLDGAAQDELLKITTQDGRELLFKYVGDAIVQPNDSAAIRAEIPNSLLLMTCTGSNFQKRRILQFEYLGSKQVTLTEQGSYEYFA